MRAVLRFGGAAWESDLDRPVSLALRTSFEGAGLHCFGVFAVERT